MSGASDERREMAKQGGRKKHSFHFPEWMARELEAEAARLDRSTSWIVQRAWKLARAAMARSAPSRVARPRDARAATGAPSPLGAAFAPAAMPAAASSPGQARSAPPA